MVLTLQRFNLLIMKYSTIKHIATAVILGVAASATAQDTYSGYFNEGYEYRFRMNPAFGNESQNFISVPAIANINFGLQGNLDLADLVYNRNGQTVLFTNPLVSSSEFLGNLNDVNRLGTDLNITLLATGFKAWGGYNTISINARGNLETRVPRELFSLLKEGVQNTTYDISDFNARANAYAEIALGHSRDINSKVRVGGALKFLVGGGNVDARLNNARLSLGTDNWIVETDAQVNASVKGLEYQMEYDENLRHEYVNGAEIDEPGIGGFGMAADLGVVYTLNNDWQFSASLLDLGFISWSNNMLATTNGVKRFVTDAYTFNVDDDAPNSFENEFDEMKDDLKTLYHLDNAGDQGSRTTMLSSTLNFGVRYSLPVYRKLTFGLTNSTRLAGDYTATEFRLSANVAPIKVFSASANVAYGTYGFGFGWLLNYHYTGVGLFLGMDHTMGKITKDGIPLSSNASLNFGMNILF